jgi:hypothetical protein
MRPPVRLAGDLAVICGADQHEAGPAETAVGDCPAAPGLESVVGALLELLPPDAESVLEPAVGVFVIGDPLLEPRAVFCGGCGKGLLSG